MRTSLPTLAVLALILSLTPADAQPSELLRNGSFEESWTAQGSVSVDQGFGVWSLGDASLVPTGWTLNPAYPGSLAFVAEGAPEGGRFLRITGDAKREAHVFQPCAELRPGKAYQISARVRGDAASLGFYEYYTDGAIRVVHPLQAPAAADWTLISALYFPRGESFRSASVAIMVPNGRTLEVDAVSIQEAPEMTMPEGLGPVVLESDTVRMVISPTGILSEFTCKATGINYAPADAATPLFSIQINGSEIPLLYLRRQGSVLDLQFAQPGVKASLKFQPHRDYFTLALRSVTPGDAQQFGLLRLGLSITHNVGSLLNAAWDKDFAACVLACNGNTHAYGSANPGAVLSARSYAEYGLQGAEIAIIGVPLDEKGPTGRLLDAIEQVELEQGLPHPTINGVWIKRAPERFSSYLMSAGLSEANVDEVVEFARGGFGCVELLNWWQSTPRYDPHPGLFPNGLDGMKSCADKIRAAGMEVGMHAMQAMVGWGGVGMGDPYVSPVADSRLKRDREIPLAADIDPAATEVPAQGDVSDWPEQGDLFIDGELVRYAGRTANAFTGCTRGLHNTHARAHRAGTQVSHMVNCFNMWDHVIYAPDVNSTMVDEVCGNIARVFNVVGAQMAYFDGGEEIAVQPPHWRNQGKVALGVFDRLEDGLILEGNALYTQHAWHVITRGSPHYDPIYYGRRDYTLRNKGQNPANWAKNLLTGDVGWFAPHTRSNSIHAVTPDEVMLLCLKAVGGKAPISFQVYSGNLYANKRMPEMLEIIRACDQIKREELFSDALCAELSRPWAEHSLDRAPDGAWQVRPMQCSWPEVLAADATGSAPCAFANPHQTQRPWVRLRALSRLSELGAPENLVLADCAQGPVFQPGETASPELTQALAPSAENAPDGSPAFAFSATNNAASASAWTQVSHNLERPVDLSRHRALGVWVHSPGKGGILNLQLAQGHGFRDHYIDLDYTGWRYHVLSVGETSRFYDYKWPHNWVSLMYWPFSYAGVHGVNLLLNALPANSEVTCLVGRIEALREHEDPVRNPSLEVGGKRLTFPVDLAPEEYLEVDWDGSCRHFEPNGGLLAQVAPAGELTIGEGDNALRFLCAAQGNLSRRVELTLATRGAPLDNTGGKAAGSTSSTEPAADAMHLVHNTGRGLRLVDGLFERIGAESARSISAFDGAANVWSVHNASAAPRKLALVLDYTAAAKQVTPDDASATVLDAFDDLAAYEMSEANQYAQYVLGGGRVLTDAGPVREGVTQTWQPAESGPGGKPAVRFGADNQGGAGGWCGKGRLFEPALDLSGKSVLGLWVHGDAGGQLLKIQFRDAAGAWLDWNVKIDFTGWQRQSLAVAPGPGFDWSRVRYVIFYYNDLPVGRPVEVGLSSLIASSAGAPVPALESLEFALNGQGVSLGEPLPAGQALLVDDQGRLSRWAPGMRQSRQLDAQCPALSLQPGENRLELRGTPGAVSGLSVRVVAL